MMNPSQFQQWCRERELPAETVDLIARIRFLLLALAVCRGEQAMYLGCILHTRWESASILKANHSKWARST